MSKHCVSKIICVFFASCLIVEQGVASSDTEFFQVKALEVLGELSEHSLLKEDRAQIQDIKIKSYETKVVSVSEVSFPTEIEGADRKTAYWDYNKNTIYVNFKAFNALPKEIQKYTALHEYLGLYQYQDKNYKISSKIYLILNQVNVSVVGNRQKLDSLKKKIVSDQILLRNTGGGTVVGGGGEGDSIAYKAYLLWASNYIKKQKEYQTHEMYQIVLWFLDELIVNSVVETRESSVFDYRHENNKLVILMPKDLWKMNQIDAQSKSLELSIKMVNDPQIIKLFEAEYELL